MTHVRHDDLATCRVCGCTTARACPGGCYWVPDFDPPDGDRPTDAGPNEGLCSACSGEDLVDDVLDLLLGLPVQSVVTITVRDGLL